MTKKIILHIGPHKTGTTTVQAWALRNDKVLSHHNVYYPKTGRNEDGNHSELAWSISSNGRSSAEIFDELLAEVEGLDDSCTIFLSGEEFEYLSESDIASLRERLDKYATKILMTLRPQHEIIRSQYGEWLKQFLTIDEFSYFWRIHSRFPEYNYLEVTRRWGRHFGLGNLVIMSLSETNLKPGGLIGELCHLIHVPLAKTERPERKNMSEPAEILLLWRYMLQKVQLRTGTRFGIEDPTLGSGKVAELEAVRERYKSIVGATRKLYESGNHQRSKFIGYSKIELLEVQDKFHDSNEELFKLAGRKLWDRDNNYESGTKTSSIPISLIKEIDNLFVQIDDAVASFDATPKEIQDTIR